MVAAFALPGAPKRQQIAAKRRIFLAMVISFVHPPRSRRTPIIRLPLAFESPKCADPLFLKHQAPAIAGRPTGGAAFNTLLHSLAAAGRNRHGGAALVLWPGDAEFDASPAKSVRLGENKYLQLRLEALSSQNVARKAIIGPL